ncbi:MAG: tRNA 4-thiouridine(8) synthase ThiI [Eubacteriales bacterium]|nr:tRNA 4-thiouridine(8) synthase ThiI [Eubacteriales bacterium]
MKEIILVKYGEIILKGGNRPVFERVLIKNIRNALKEFSDIKITIAQATIYIDTPEENIDDVCDRLSRVFGIVSISRAGVCEKSIESIKKAAVEYLSNKLKAGMSFKVEAKRSDKRFELNSIQIAQQVGGAIHEGIEGVIVDVHNPQVLVRAEVRDDAAYVYSTLDKINGRGGMPTGTGGIATLLLSGGIDSPVAGYMIAKRGVELNAVNFFSFPYTSDRAKEKVVELARILSGYLTKINLYVVPFTEIQLEIRDKCPEEHMTLIMRRFMMKISEIVAKKTKSAALITGESVGQVASQTLAALNVTNSVCEIPVLRPLVGMDKDEIIERARDIGTFETSILPYEDCCTVFTPKHPTTNPKLEIIERSEAALDVDGLIEKAVEGIEIIEVYPDMEDNND